MVFVQEQLMIKAKKISKKLKRIHFVFSLFFFIIQNQLTVTWKKLLLSTQSLPTPEKQKWLPLLKMGHHQIPFLDYIFEEQRGKICLGTLGRIYSDLYQGADFWIDQCDVWMKCLHSIRKGIGTVDLILKINENYRTNFTLMMVC